MKKYPKNMADIILRALEYTTDGIVIGNKDGTVYYHNKAWLRIHAQDENLDLRGKNIRDYERPELWAILDDLNARLWTRGYYTYQLGTVRRDGLYHDVLITANIIREVDPPLAVVILREITDLVQMQKEIARRNVELSLFDDMHSIIAKGRRKKTVIRRLLKLLIDFIGAKTGGVYFVDHSKREGTLIDLVGAPSRTVTSVRHIPMEGRAFKKMLESRHAFVVEEELPGYIGGKEDVRRALGVKRTIAIVLRTGIRGDYVVMLGMGEAETIGPEIRAFLEASAKRFGIAIERMELLETLERRERELHNLSMRLIESGEEERRQCSRMLHDEVGQTIAALKLELEMLEKDLSPMTSCTRRSLDTVRKQLRSVADGTRTLSKSLHPAMLDELGLVPTLNWYIDNFVRSASLEVEFNTMGFDEDLPRATTLTLYRVAQESLTNVVRHAGASRVTISLTKGYPCVIMEIEDNGRGISLKQAKMESKGLGLVSMRERVELVGGAFRVKSSPGEGTKVRVKIPIEANDV